MEREAKKRAEAVSTPSDLGVDSEQDDADQALAGSLSISMIRQSYRGRAVRSGPGPAVAQRRPSPKAFDRLAKGRVKKKNAPRTLVLPAAISTGMQKAWNRSLASGGKTEHGGNLVRNRSGSYGFRPGKPSKLAGVFFPDEEDVGKGQKLVGTGHTHPYQSGITDISFSGEDIAGIVNEEEPINILQSGKSVFLIARTAEFEKLLKGLDDDGYDALEAKIQACWDAAYKQSKGSMVARVEAAVVRTCKEFHLLYYKGSGRTLGRAA